MNLIIYKVTAGMQKQFPSPLLDTMLYPAAAGLLSNAGQRCWCEWTYEVNFLRKKQISR